MQITKIAMFYYLKNLLNDYRKVTIGLTEVNKKRYLADVCETKSCREDC